MGMSEEWDYYDEGSSVEDLQEEIAELEAQLSRLRYGRRRHIARPRINRTAHWLRKRLASAERWVARNSAPVMALAEADAFTFEVMTEMCDFTTSPLKTETTLTFDVKDLRISDEWEGRRAGRRLPRRFVVQIREAPKGDK
jgi:hypothetical protein